MTLGVPNVFKMLRCSMFTKTETTKPNALDKSGTKKKDTTCRDKRTDPKITFDTEKLHYRTLRPSTSSLRTFPRSNLKPLTGYMCTTNTELRR